MAISLSRAGSIPEDLDAIGIGVFTGRVVVAGAPAQLDLDYLEEQGFEGNAGETMSLGSAGRTVVAVGLGDQAKLDAQALRKAAAGFVRAAWKVKRAGLFTGSASGAIAASEFASAVAEGACLAAYRFTKYKGVPKPCLIEQLVVAGANDPDIIDAGLSRGALIARATTLARDLVNEPAGSLTPIQLADRAVEVAQSSGLDVDVFDELRIEAEGLGGLRGVSLGSNQPPRLIKLTYMPANPRATIALVGKGITFDSGGLSIKSADGMMTMKTDMSGAAAVLGAMSVLHELAPDVAVIGFMPTTENMSGGSATKPGDVLKIRNGKTVEVLNTDAEGRLVLADGLSLAVEAKPDAIVDLATLTGACVVALGKEIAGLMGNNDALLTQMTEASQRAGESLWTLPLPAEYRKHIDSEIADIKNIGSGGEAGTLSAGLFLKEFVDDIPWAHLDIAGPARAGSDSGYISQGGTGFGVRTLINFILNFQPLT